MSGTHDRQRLFLSKATSLSTTSSRMQCAPGKIKINHFSHGNSGHLKTGKTSSVSLISHTQAQKTPE